MEELKFSVDSALLSELGEKLVETVHVALVELIKNSNDADARLVTVSIIPSKKLNEGPEIQIADDGLGMTFDEVKKYWMRIATTNKLANNKSKIYGRAKTGAKGIGRFACRRLGNELKLITTALREDGLYDKTEVVFLWKKFTAGSEVTNITCDGKTETLKTAKTGTTLIITKAATDEWKIKGYDYLKRQVAVLAANHGIQRPGFEYDPGLNIILNAPTLEKGKPVKDLREELMSAGWGTLEGHVNASGHGVYDLSALGLENKKTTSTQIFRRLKNVKFKIGIFPTKPKTDFRNPKLLSKFNLEHILPQWGGVQVRYNGFRVYPFGEDDWLDIDKDRGRSLGKPINELFEFAQKLKGINPTRTLLAFLSMRSYMGAVDIDSQAIGFEMKASREGFVGSDAVAELKSFVRYGIEWATIYRDFYVTERTKKESEQARKQLEAVIRKPTNPEVVVEDAVSLIKKEIKNISTFVPRDQRQKVASTFSSATEAILKHDKTNKQELHHLRLIASTSTLLLIFSHEVKSLIGNLGSDSGDLEILEGKLSGNDAKIVNKMRKQLEETKGRFADLLNMTSVISVDSKTATPQRLALLDRIEKAKKCFARIVADYDIDLNIEVAANIIVGPVLEGELYAILLNTLSNSIKSVIAGNGERRIDFVAIKDAGRVLIKIKDTGIGIKKEHFNDVFVPFIADPDGRLYSKLAQRLNPEDKYIVGTGSGLGLSIVKEIIQVRKGKISFSDPVGIWKAILEIELP